MQITKTINEARKLVAEAKKRDLCVGFVPTMGALHEGHTSLIDAARQSCGFVVVSIFVNPTQFGPAEDLNKYPRPIENDLEKCRLHGADIVFIPDVSQMYPSQQLTWVDVDKVSESMCGRSRPGHFRGVSTVCTKLFNIISPEKAFFGQKDAQQVAVIKQMVTDLNMPLEIIVCPTVREPDGLAMSSRNQYLSPENRKIAPIIYKALCCARDLAKTGVNDTAKLEKAVQNMFAGGSSIELEYICIVNPDHMGPLKKEDKTVLIAVAAKIGSTRLIDNILVDLTV